MGQVHTGLFLTGLHLDHILITNEIFNGLTRIQTQTIKIDSYMDGGWSEYDYIVSDHRPVAIKIFNFTTFYDLNDDGLVDNSDLEILVSYVIEQKYLWRYKSKF